MPRAISKSALDKIFRSRTVRSLFLNTHGIDDAITLALEMVRNDVEVIISRRKTAHLLRENLRIPVLSFPHRSLDICISLTQAKEEGNKLSGCQQCHAQPNISSAARCPKDSRPNTNSTILFMDYEIDTSASAWHTLTYKEQRHIYARALIFKWLEIKQIWFLA